MALSFAGFFMSVVTPRQEQSDGLRYSFGALSYETGLMATIGKTPSGTWKATIRKQGWPTTIKTFRIKRDAVDWERKTEDEMVRGVHIFRSHGDRLTFSEAMDRCLREVTPTKHPIPKRSKSGVLRV
jgi:hypothetical protein